MRPEIMGLELAAAISNAGGLGIMSFAGYPPPLNASGSFVLLRRNISVRQRKRCPQARFV